MICSHLNYRMIKNITESHLVEKIKWRFLTFEIQFLKENSNSSYLTFFLFVLVQTFLRSLIYFKSGFFASPFLSSFFLNLLGQNWDDLLSLKDWHIDTFIVVMCIIGYVILMIGFFKNIELTAHIIFYYYILTFLLNVPFTSLLADNLKYLAIGNLSPFFFIMKALSALVLIIGSFLIIFLIFYDFKPTREDNILWKISNYPIFCSIIFDKIRTFIVTWGQIDVLPLLLSLSLEMKILKYKKQKNSGFLIGKTSAISDILEYSIIACHLAAMLFFLSKDQALATKVFFALIILVMLNTLSSFSEASCREKTLPICTNNNKAHLYNFYFSNIKNCKSGFDEQITQLVVAHSLCCSQKKCKIRCLTEDQEQVSTRNLIQKFQQIFTDQRRDSPEDEIFYELWRHELYMKVSFDSKTRKYSPEHEFIVRYITAQKIPGIAGVPQLFIRQTTNNNQQIIDIHKSIVLRLLYQILDYYESLYHQLNKVKPKLSILIDNLQKIYRINLQISSHINQMHLLKKLDFTLVELYLSFLKTFLAGSKLNEFYGKKLGKVKIIKHFDDIKKIDRPCFYLNAQNGKIEQFNKQTMKFLHAKKFELRQKKFEQFIQPKLTLSAIKQCFQNPNLDNKTFLFFQKKLQNSHLCHIDKHIGAYVTVQEKSISNRLHCMILIQPKSFSLNTVDILIDSCSYDLVISSRTTIECRESQTLLSVSQIYNKNLREEIQSFEHYKAKKIFFQFNDKKYSTHIVQSKYIDKNYRHFSVRVTPDYSLSQEKKGQRFTLLCQKYSNFFFSYDDNQGQGFILEGSSKLRKVQPIQQQLLSRFKTENNEKKLEDLLIDLCSKRNACFSEGIKTYRLYKKELYNIDLEDKAAYEQQFNGLQPEYKDQFQLRKDSNVCYNSLAILLIVIIIVVIIFGTPIFFDRINNNLILHRRTALIYFFSLSVGRINAIIRDQVNGLYHTYNQDFRADINVSLAHLQSYSSYSVFDSGTSYDVKYGNQSLQGNLNELYQYAIDKCQELTSSQDAIITKQFLNFVIEELGEKLKSERKVAIEGVKQAKFDILAIAFVGSILFWSLNFFLFIVLLAIQSNYHISYAKMLRQLLMFSQSKIKKTIQDAIKYKEYFSSAIKNHDVSVSYEEFYAELFKERKKPKEIATGIKTRICQIILGSIVLLSMMMLAGLGILWLYLNLNSINLMVKQEEAFASSYIGLVEVSTQLALSGNFPEAEYNYIGSMLNILEEEKENLQFTQELNQDISAVVYERACNYLQFYNSTDTSISDNLCSNTQPYFIIEDPLELGLIFYFRDQHYNLLQNLTETYASTGLFSAHFFSLALDIMQRTFEETSSKIDNLQLSLKIVGDLVAFGGVFFILFYGVYIFWFERKTQRLQQAIRFLGYRPNSSKKQYSQSQTHLR